MCFRLVKHLDELHPIVAGRESRFHASRRLHIAKIDPFDQKAIAGGETGAAHPGGGLDFQQRDHRNQHKDHAESRDKGGASLQHRFLPVMDDGSV
jgi:hypothetical protein